MPINLTMAFRATLEIDCSSNFHRFWLDFARTEFFKTARKQLKKISGLEIA